MKKIILLLGILCTTISTVQAACDYNCVEPYNLNTKFKTFMSSVSGFNALTEKKVESIIAKEILKIASADELKVDMDSYSPRDLRNGIFKSLSVNGKNVLINDIHLSALNLATLCDFNYIKQVDKEIVFVEDMPMAFNIQMNQSSINKTMAHPKYQKVIDDFNKLAASYGAGIRVSSTKVALKASKFYYIIGFEFPFVKQEQRIVLESDLNTKNGKINLTNTKLVSGRVALDLRKIDFIMNYLNPLDFSVKILDNKDAKVNVKDIAIKNNVIHADGIITLPKD